MSETYDLARFETAQEPVIGAVLEELRLGRKRSHWMWFVFPQIAGLGSSPMARTYAIVSLDEARAYLAHPILLARLVTCTRLVLQHADRPLDSIFGTPDDVKFGSSMTLFMHAAADTEPIFRVALERFCDGAADEGTLALLQSRPDDRRRVGE